MDEFTKSYIETALWSSCDENDDPLDKRYGIEHISENCLAQMIADCQAFQENNAQWLTKQNVMVSYDSGSALVRGGHDFWLTRNGHGAGFWDGDWSIEAGIALTKASKIFGNVDLYVGNDEKIYSN